MSTHFLPYARHEIDDDDIAAVVAALKGDWLTQGPAVDTLEAAFTEVTGARHAVACNSGTAALHLAALALRLGPGDAVIVPSLTFLATANTVRYTGAEVVFADVDPETGLVSEPHWIAAHERGGRAVKAIFPVHLAGQCVDMGALKSWATRANLKIVEDACHALGGTMNGQPIGSCTDSDASCFSLHPAKLVAMGEGGIVTTNSTDLANAMRRFRNHGMTRDASEFRVVEQAFDDQGQVNPWYYEMPEPGFNYRAPDILCALGVSQLRKLGRYRARRRELVARYDHLIARLAPGVRALTRRPNQAPTWHLYVALVDFEGLGVSRSAVMRRLRDRGIGTQVHYLPLHRQPYYRERYGTIDLPGADAYYARALALPLFPAMTDSDVDRVVDTLADAIAAR